jgi:hypothetical protein
MVGMVPPPPPPPQGVSNGMKPVDKTVSFNYSFWYAINYFWGLSFISSFVVIASLSGFELLTLSCLP